MILYHGSTVEISTIDVSKSRPNKDFGKGFYLSANRQQALRMADEKPSDSRTGLFCQSPRYIMSYLNS